jgi:hypothetical protein
MKIDYKSYPILEKLSNKNIDNLPIHVGDRMFFGNEKYKDMFKNYWKLANLDFSKEINVISKPFMEASSKAMPKLSELLRDILSNDTSDFDVKGTYIIGDRVIMISYSVLQGSENQEKFFYVFDKSGVPLMLNVQSEIHNILEVTWISNVHGLQFNSDLEVKQFMAMAVHSIFIYKMFKSYAQVETKYLKPNQKFKDIICKYKNDTKLNLCFLDSKWFTNLVKSDGFTVRGHFRLQPKKINGEMSKELIWISEFQKTGYTAPARMLS